MHTLHVRSLTLPRVFLPVVMVALPLVLLLSSLRTFQELEEQKTVYLRSRAAMVAGGLETLKGAPDADQAFAALGEAEPALYDLELIARERADPVLEALWDGRELFRTGFAEEDGKRLFRAWVPFHSEVGTRIARIDLDASAADFLVVHARHNVIVSSIGGLVVLALALYAIWMARREARARLRQLELEHLAHIGKMSAVLAHEIRNPLGTIKGFAQLIGERPEAGAPGLVEPIVNETRRLESLVDDLLLYGRPPVPAMRLAPWPDTAAAIEDYARHQIAGRAIRFHADRPALEWETDPQILRQALLNLVRNAIEAVAGEPPGEVRVEVRRGERAGVTVAVVDNGPGFPEQARARLFEPFFTTKAFGTGLGLSITRNLARSLGGELVVWPASPRGAEVALRFPAARVAARRE